MRGVCSYVFACTRVRAVCACARAFATCVHPSAHRRSQAPHLLCQLDLFLATVAQEAVGEALYVPLVEVRLLLPLILLLHDPLSLCLGLGLDLGLGTAKHKLAQAQIVHDPTEVDVLGLISTDDKVPVPRSLLVRRVGQKVKELGEEVRVQVEKDPPPAVARQYTVEAAAAEHVGKPRAGRTAQRRAAGLDPAAAD